jgi:hypothetical protein
MTWIRSWVLHLRAYIRLNSKAVGRLMIGRSECLRSEFFGHAKVASNREAIQARLLASLTQY